MADDVAPPRAEPAPGVWQPALRRGARVLLVVIVLGTLCTASLIALAGSRIIGEFQIRERVTFLIGAIGQDAALLRTELRLATENAEAPDYSSLKRREALLNRHVDQLFASIVHEDKLQGAMRTALDQMRQSHAVAIAALVAGDFAAARAALDQSIIETTELFTALHDLYLIGGERVESSLKQADRVFRGLVVAEFVVLAIVAAVLVIIWIRMHRRLENAQRSVARHVASVEAANRELDAFAARVAHDFKNLLTPMMLAADALLQSVTSPAHRKHAERIKQSATQALRLINGLLAFARAGTSAFNEAVADVGQTAAAVGAELELMAKQAGVALRVSAEPGVRAACAPEMLFTLLYNLAGNAVKYSEGSRDPAVVISSRSAAPWVEIEVADNGPGIAPQALAHVFEPFYRDPGVQAAGSGIGLATVKRITEAFGGLVEVFSNLGQGTCVRVRLPQAAGAADRRARDQGGELPP